MNIVSVIFLALITGAAWSEGVFIPDVSPFIGGSVSGGYTVADDNEGFGIDFNAVLIIFNGSLEIYNWADEFDGHSETHRGYLGLGFGPMFQLQGGVGEGGGLTCAPKSRSLEIGVSGR